MYLLKHPIDYPGRIEYYDRCHAHSVANALVSAHQTVLEGVSDFLAMSFRGTIPANWRLQTISAHGSLFAWSLPHCHCHYSPSKLRGCDRPGQSKYMGIDRDVRGRICCKRSYVICSSAQGSFEWLGLAKLWLLSQLCRSICAKTIRSVYIVKCGRSSHHGDGHDPPVLQSWVLANEKGANAAIK